MIFLHNGLINFRLAPCSNSVTCNIPIFSLHLLVRNFFFSCDSWHRCYSFLFFLSYLTSHQLYFSYRISSAHHFVPSPYSSFNQYIDTDASFAVSTDLSVCSFFGCICLKHFEFCHVPREPVAVQLQAATVKSCANGWPLFSMGLAFNGSFLSKEIFVFH